MKFIVGLDEDNIIVSGCVVFPMQSGGKESQLFDDIKKMIKQGLTIKMIECKSVTVGNRLDFTKYTSVVDVYLDELHNRIVSKDKLERVH